MAERRVTTMAELTGHDLNPITFQDGGEMREGVLARVLHEGGPSAINRPTSGTSPPG